MKLLSRFSATLPLFGLLFVACKPDPLPVPPAPVPKIQFDSLTVGQSSRYLGWTSDDADDDLTYSDDTLVLTIISQNGNGFLVSETLRPEGDVNPIFETDKNKEYRYYIKLKGDTIHIDPSASSSVRSRMFAPPLGRIGFPKSRFANQSVAIVGWKTDIPFCFCLSNGFVENLTLLGASYPYLNVLVDNTPMSYKSVGQTIVYAEESGIVRISANGFASSGFGWDLLPGE